MAKRVLILGGTTEARELSALMATDDRLAVTLSLAGRTQAPVAHPVPVRTGGFGGADGLAEYMRHASIDLVIDATHPYAARISANAVRASSLTGTPLIRLDRPPWERLPADRWVEVADTASAVAALGSASRRVFLALGRNEVHAFEAAPQHFYLVRSVDPVTPPLAVSQVHYVLARGPFNEAADCSLLQQHRIDVVVSKNSGGRPSYSKISAARTLGIEVVMIGRPLQMHAAVAASAGEAWASALQLLGLAERGV